MNWNGNFPIWAWTDWSGVNSTGASLGQDCPGVKDATNCQGDSSLFALYDDQPDSKAIIIQTDSTGVSTELYDWEAPWYNGDGNTGVVMANLRAIDMPIYTSGPFEFYTLEKIPDQNTGEIEKWSGSTPTFEGSFGKGFLYDPLDISVDSSGNVFVLEKNSSARAGDMGLRFVGNADRHKRSAELVRYVGRSAEARCFLVHESK